MFGKSKKNNCLNPKCKSNIRQPILIHNLSTKPKKTYYGCPNCFFEVKKTSKFQKRESKINPKKRKEQTSSSCLHYYGFLSSRLKDTAIPQECLVCPKLLECMRN